MSAVRRWAELTRTEIGDVAEHALTVFPVGSTEQHGPHLATGTDATLVTAIAERAAAAAARPDTVLLAPTLGFGASDHHVELGATLSLHVTTFQRVLSDLLSSAVKAGCRRLFILNGHGGNTAACTIAASEAVRDHGVVCATAIYSQLLDPEIIDAPIPGHAGMFETSLMLAVAADHVRMDKARPSPGGAARRRRRGLVVGEPGRWEALDGFTDMPQSASATSGATLLEQCVQAVAAAFEDVADLHV